MTEKYDEPKQIEYNNKAHMNGSNERKLSSVNHFEKRERRVVFIKDEVFEAEHNI